MHDDKGFAAFAVAANALASPHTPYLEKHAQVLSEVGLERAWQMIAGWPGYRVSPLHHLAGFARSVGVEAIAYKDEGGRFGLGSFKALGGAYAVAELVAEKVHAERGVRPAPQALASGEHADVAATLTVCCATDGNHGRSVAWGAQMLGARCVIFLHEAVSAARQVAIERFGADVVRTPGNYDDSVREAARRADAEGWTVVSDTSYPGYRDIPRRVMQGYEVMATEAFDELAWTPTHIVLQTGVGGMAAAVAACAKRRWGSERPHVVLADPARAACWVASFQAGAPTAVGGALDTVMAGLACGEVSSLAWDILSDHADFAVAVPDDVALQIMQDLARGVDGDVPIVAGESATAGLAVLVGAVARPALREALALTAASRVLVFGTEADTDPELFSQIVGMSAEEVLGRAA